MPLPFHAQHSKRTEQKQHRGQSLLSAGDLHITLNLYSELKLPPSVVSMTFDCINMIDASFLS